MLMRMCTLEHARRVFHCRGKRRRPTCGCVPALTLPCCRCLAAAAAPFAAAPPGSDLYGDAGCADGDEPELRKQLRAARAADKHAKMKAALAEKQAKEAAEANRREQQQAHKAAHRERIEAWKNKNKV